MNLTTGTAYNTRNLYYTPSESLSGETAINRDADSKNAAGTPAVNSDKVTISKDVAIARTRESLGLNPTGRLILGDVETVAADQKQIVESTLSSLRESLGIAEDQQITLSLDQDSAITIKESFTGKKELENALNEDGEFYQAFTRLSGAEEFLGYTKSLQTNSVSLADFMNSDVSLDDIFSLASRYSTLKSSDNPLGTLLALSKAEMPYTFVSGPAQQ